MRTAILVFTRLSLQVIEPPNVQLSLTNRFHGAYCSIYITAVSNDAHRLLPMLDSSEASTARVRGGLPAGRRDTNNAIRLGAATHRAVRHDAIRLAHRLPHFICLNLHNSQASALNIASGLLLIEQIVHRKDVLRLAGVGVVRKTVRGNDRQVDRLGPN